jgi:hypothetical protein
MRRATRRGACVLMQAIGRPGDGGVCRPRGMHARVCALRSKRYWIAAGRPGEAVAHDGDDLRATRGGGDPGGVARRGGDSGVGGGRLAPGVTTATIDGWVREDTARRGGRPSQLGYHGFPASVCTSRNAVVCHGIPRADEAAAGGGHRQRRRDDRARTGFTGTRRRPSASARCRRGAAPGRDDAGGAAGGHRGGAPGGAARRRGGGDRGGGAAGGARGGPRVLRARHRPGDARGAAGAPRRARAGTGCGCGRGWCSRWSRC